MRHSLPAEVMLPLLALLAKLCSVPSGNLPKANVLAVLVFLAFADSNAALSTGTGLVYELYPRLPVDGVSEFHVQVSVVSICIVASEFAGIVPNGGIGTFYSTLAETLATAGHQVTLLYTQGTRSHHAKHNYEYWVNFYLQKGIQLVPLPFWRPRSVGYHSGTAFMVYDWLRQHRYDVVHFPDWQGHGYYALLAKHLGLDFSRTTMCCMIHGPLYWARTSNAHALDTLEDIETDFLERGSIRAAEVLISPSHYLINWIANQTWEIPDSIGAIRTEPYILPHEAQRVMAKVSAASGISNRSKWERSEVTELVFFGRLEVRKGIVLFADALDALIALHDSQGNEVISMHLPLAVSFLGSDRNDILGIPSREYIMQRAAAWGGKFLVTIITNKDSSEALSYLKGHGRMAVMPSLVENSPLSILELMGACIPFVASTAGGIPELISSEFRPKVLFDPTLDGITFMIKETLNEGALVPLPQYDMGQVEQSWVNFHVSEASKHASARALEIEANDEKRDVPDVCLLEDVSHSCKARHDDGSASVSIVVIAGGHASLLQASIQSVVDQVAVYDSWGGPQVTQLIVVMTAAADMQNNTDPHLWKKWQTMGGQFVSATDGVSFAEARNTAMKHVSGSVVVFIDAGCVLETFAMKTMLKVYQKTGAVAITSFVKFYSGNIPATATAQQLASTQGMEQWFQVYLGGSASTGLLRNVFGGPLILMTAEAFRSVGGYNVQLPAGYDHWELLSKINLAELRHEVIPMVLSWAPTTSMNGIAVQDYAANKHWRLAVAPHVMAKLANYSGAHWRTVQSVNDAFTLMSKYLRVDLTNDEILRRWLRITHTNGARFLQTTSPS